MMRGGERVAGSAKARVRRASLLTSEDFRQLLELTSVGDIAVRLGKGTYAPMLKGFALEEMRRSDLEFLLGVSILAEGVAFRHYAGGDGKKLLDLWLEYFDVTLFKNHLRLKMGTGQWDEHLSPDKVLDMVSGYHLTLVDKDRLFSASSLKDIITSVKNADIRAALFEAVPGRESETFSQAQAQAQGPEFQKAIFNIGMTLDRCYFNNLYGAVTDLGGVDGRMLRALVGTRVDLINMYWIYRARRFFNMSPEEALTLIMKARYRANFELLTKVAFAEPLALAAALSGTPYAGVFEAGSDAALREAEIECHIYRYLFAVAERAFSSGVTGFHNVAAYLVLKELEVRDLVAVVESVRYGFDKNKAGLLLVRPLALGKVG
jgi:V/A-type H+-transporting ATPase subunit C